MIDFIQVGKKITFLRRQIDLSQEDLASKLFITRQCLSKWEVGNSIPSTEMILQMTKIFNVSIDEILCLDQEVIVDENNIFKGHERIFIINQLINNRLDCNIPDIFYQLSPQERMLVLNSIKLGTTKCDMNDLYVKLTESEKKYIGGK